VVEATRQYRSDMDNLGDWIADCCSTGAKAVFTPTARLYANYDQWTRGCNLRPMSINAFAHKLEERGFKSLDKAAAPTPSGLASETSALARLRVSAYAA
jgi:phage/plasmid-associated DNA primase